MSIEAAGTPRIDVAGLGKSFGGQRAIAGFDLRVTGGELIVLVGANGGGKTTSLRMLAGLIAPDAGTGDVLGRDVRQPQRADRARIGFMTQRIGLYPELTVRDNLMFRARMHGLDRAGARVDEAISVHGLARYAAARAAHLSVGWARRVQFAATLLHAPPLLLLDEPTAGLDPVTREDIWEQLAALADAGHSVIVSTHDLAEAERCGRLIYFQDGEADGPMTPEALRTRGGAATLDAAVIALARHAVAR